MKNTMTRGFIAMVVLVSASLLASCAKDMPSQASADSQPLQGTWAYQSTDGHDLSGYGITYSFQGTTWTYNLGDAGQKQYDFSTSGDQFTATLRANSLNSGESAGTQMAGQYAISGDTLKMISGGHTAVLVKE